MHQASKEITGKNLASIGNFYYIFKNDVTGGNTDEQSEENTSVCICRVAVIYGTQ